MIHEAHILVVDDEPLILEFCAVTLKRLSNVNLVLESESRRAAERLVADHFDLMIADIRMPGLDGMELLKIAHQHDPALLVIMITAYPNVDTTIESMRLGVADYLIKPFKPDDFLIRVHRVLKERRLREEYQLLQRQVERRYAFDELIGISSTMQTVFETMKQAAANDFDVLIRGETGTGKELVARSIHNQSPRKQGPFVAVHCGAIPENLLESELFGYERGAFSGAYTRNIGLFEFADSGTVFLDEIGELPLPLQVKLLRVLQERKIRRIGGKKEIDLNIRVLAATARDLHHEVQEGRFRDDLYYRINVISVDLPPLRRRREDIPLLIEYFVNRYAREMGKGMVHVDPEVIAVLSHYPWPGNVRELQNVLKQALTMIHHPALLVDDLPDEIVIQADDQTPQGIGGFFALRAQRNAMFEKAYLTTLLQGCQGDIVRAARKARLPRSTLYRLLKKYDLVPDEFRA